MSLTELYRGRYRMTTDVPAERLTLDVAPQAAGARARALLVRLAQPGAAQLGIHSADPASPSIAPARVEASGLRSVTPLPASPAVMSLTFVAEEGPEPVPFVLDEVGFFEEDRGLLNDVRPLFAWIPAVRFYGTLLPWTIARLFVFCVIASFVVPGAILRKAQSRVAGLHLFRVLHSGCGHPVLALRRSGSSIVLCSRAATATAGREPEHRSVAGVSSASWPGSDS